MELRHVIHGLVLYILQVLVFQQMQFEIIGGLKVVVFLAPIYILLLPMYTSRLLVLVVAFVFGLLLDFWYGHLGLHTSCLLTIAYLRLIVFRIVLSESELNGIIFNKRTSLELIPFAIVSSILMVVYSFLFFLLDYFVLAKLGIALVSGLFSGLISAVFGLVYKMILGPR